MGPEDLAGVAVTHIHLDHAGGVGDVAKAFPRATVYVHEKGARHLVDPTRLVRSAAHGLRRLARLALRTARTDSRRSASTCSRTARTSGEPDRVLTTVDSPGHAKHHLALHDSQSGILFVGDAVGVRLPDAGVLRPATPPPDFDLDLAITSLHKFVDRNPAEVALAHYGLVPDPIDTCTRPRESCASGPKSQRRRSARGETSPALDVAFSSPSRAPTLRSIAEKLESTLNGVHSNAAGFRRWLSTRDAAGGSSPEGS